MNFSDLISHPLARIALQFCAACLAVGFLGRWTPLDYLATVAAGCLAATIWILEHEPDLAARLRTYGPVSSWLDLVAGWLGSAERQPSLADQPGPWRVADAEFMAIEQKARQTVRGHDAAITRIIEATRRGALLRQTSGSPPSTPAGAFLLAGLPGIGKRSLALCLAGQFCDPARVVYSDAGQSAWNPPSLDASRGRARWALVIENVDRGGAPAREWVRSLLEGRVSNLSWAVEDSLVFLIVHEDAQSMFPPSPNAGPGTGATVIAGALSAQTGLDSRILWACHELVPFSLPSQREQAEVVLERMRLECESQRLRLEQVDPAVVAHEVGLIGSAGSFENLEGRVSRRLAPLLHSARINRSMRIRL